MYVQQFTFPTNFLLNFITCIAFIYFCFRPNTITDTFHITITPVDDQLPVLNTNVIKVQEGMKKVISQFEIEAIDADTHDDLLVVRVSRSPQHGWLEIAGKQDAKVRW